MLKDLIPTWHQKCMANCWCTSVDVYAFGCLMIEQFGQRKVWGELLTVVEIMLKVCGFFNVAPEPPAVNHIPLHYQSMCKSCCELDTAKHPNIIAVIKELEAYSK